MYRVPQIFAVASASRRHLLSGLALCLVAGLFSPFSQAVDKIKVGYNVWVGSAGIFVAQEKGYFKEAGIEVELVPFKGPADTIPALASEHIDIALTTADNVVLANGKGAANLQVIYATDTSTGADAVVAKKPFTRLKDLKGKTVAVTEGEVNQLLLLKGLEKAGMKASDIKSMNMDPDSAGAAFIAGKVDAAVTWEPWISRAVASGNGKVVFSSAQVPNLILDVVTVKPSVAAAKRRAMQAFLAAVEKGTALLKAQPDQAYPLAAKWLEVKPEEIKGMLAGVTLYGKADNVRLLHNGTAAKALDNVSTFYLAQKTIPQMLKGSSMVDGSLVSAK